MRAKASQYLTRTLGPIRPIWGVLQVLVMGVGGVVVVLGLGWVRRKVGGRYVK